MTPEHRPDEAAIREQAYYLWEQDGRPEGHDMEYWQRASVAVAESAQLSTLVDEPPEKPAKRKTAERKASAGAVKSVRTKARPAKAAPRTKPKKQ